MSTKIDQVNESQPLSAPPASSPLNALAGEKYQTIRVPTDCIPKSGRLVEAYETASQIIVCGDPPDEPEGLTEAEYTAWYETAHNCDAMGCGSLSHVIYRFEKH